MNKTYFTCLILIIAGLSLNARETVYTVSFADYKEKRVYVEAELFLQDSILRMSGNGPVPERWDDYIDNLTARLESGDQVKVVKRGDRWILHTTPGQKVKINYEVSVTHDDILWPGGIDGVAFVKEWGYFLTGRSLFVFNLNDGDKYRVIVKNEGENNVYVPWTPSLDGFLINNHSDLTESLILYGNYKFQELKRNNLSIRFVLGGSEIQANSDKYGEIAEQVMDYYFDLMGGGPTPGGSNSANIMVVINSSKQTDGEVIGSHISMLVNPESDAQEQMVAWFMFAHEFFHLWNGKTLQVNSTRDDWFKEGVTNYYTLKSLFQVEFINMQALAGIFNGLFYQRYQNDSGLGELSMRDAAEGFSKDNHWGLIYSGGLFAGIGIDMIIREETNNQKSLDDLMRALYAKYKNRDEVYTTDEVIALANEIAGKDLTPFFDKYVNGFTEIPVQDYLKKAGFKVSIEDGNLKMNLRDDINEQERAIQNGFLGELN
ncbi:M61 family metallopeptidase [Marinigracilibium pacificum]|uniref:Peptidase M61 catalytic domain-containing protein n=1 Tax=Marinigracilibium pacificum TaxID=2729599 RepID=A0A848IWA8_9BACT|nr:hypothetical protein [Marinigracilibium pacificum]NMM47448.1 hypothetical protein [Marinigracilibium pacificum]